MSFFKWSWYSIILMPLFMIYFAAHWNILCVTNSFVDHSGEVFLSNTSWREGLGHVDSLVSLRRDVISNGTGWLSLSRKKVELDWVVADSDSIGSCMAWHTLAKYCCFDRRYLESSLPKNNWMMCMNPCRDDWRHSMHQRKNIRMTNHMAHMIRKNNTM